MYSSILDDFKMAFRRKGQALPQLILINAIIFVLMNIMRAIFPSFFNGLMTTLGLPSPIIEFFTHFWTLFSYMFIHVDLFHVLFNMLWLYWMGKIFYEYLGNKKLISTYIIGGLTGGLLYLLAYNLVPPLQGSKSILIGASAGVIAVVVGIATLLPNYTLHLFLLGPVRLKYIALGAFVLTSILDLQENTGGKIAHMGGAIWGYLYVSQYRKGKDIAKWFNNVADFIVNIFSKRKGPKMRVVHKQTKSDTKYNAEKAATQKQIDLILDKISKSGYESLSEQEKAILFNFSNQGKTK